MNLRREHLGNYPAVFRSLTGLTVRPVSDRRGRDVSRGAALPASRKNSLITDAMRIAGGQATAEIVSAKVAALTEGMIRAMFLTKVKSAGLAVAVVVTLGSGLADSWRLAR